MWKWDQQEPFGVSGPDENPSGLGPFEFPLRFAGQYADKETNLSYNMARDYSSETGRYIESDLIGLRGGLNTYAYVNQNPLTWTDPEGLAGDAFGDKPRGPIGLPDASAEAAARAAKQLSDAMRDARERQSEYNDYKRRCNERPPSGLDKCAEARWKLQRNKDCRDMRQAWDDKWQPGRHAGDVENLNQGIKNLEEWIKCNCK